MKPWSQNILHNKYDRNGAQVNDVGSLEQTYPHYVATTQMMASMLLCWEDNLSVQENITYISNCNS